MDHSKCHQCEGAMGSVSKRVSIRYHYLSQPIVFSAMLSMCGHPCRRRVGSHAAASRLACAGLTVSRCTSESNPAHCCSCSLCRPSIALAACVASTVLRIGLGSITDSTRVYPCACRVVNLTVSGRLRPSASKWNLLLNPLGERPQSLSCGSSAWPRRPFWKPQRRHCLPARTNPLSGTDTSRSPLPHRNGFVALRGRDRMHPLLAIWQSLNLRSAMGQTAQAGQARSNLCGESRELH